MQNTTFLDKIASDLIENYANNFINTVVVLPNKRAKVFLIDALKNQIEGTIFCPEIISIEDFIQDISTIRSIDSIELLFEFYAVYLSVTNKNDQQEFEVFANWAKTLLQDFNEIDRYLLEPNKVLKYLENIKEIEHWSVDTDKRTDLIEKHLAFWKLLPHYYQSFYDYLINKKIGYQGLIYREAVANLDNFSNKNNGKNYIFAGFNALNVAEEIIIQRIIDNGNGQIFWDADETFLNDVMHDAGLFLRKFKSGWKHYKSNPFEWITKEFATAKKIEIIGTPKTIGQAKIAGKIIEKLDPNALNKTAIVLGEENLLLPLLYSLPATVGSLNITMGYAAKNNPAQILIAKLFKMHTAAIKRNATNYVFYYKDVLDILTHPLVAPHSNSEKLVEIINRNNYSFITHKKIMELHQNSTPIFELLFAKWENGSAVVLEKISELLIVIKENLSIDNEQDKITKAFIYAIFKTINKLINYYQNHKNIDKIDTLYAIYKQIIDLAEVSFEGEPLIGLQIMGVLESRVLDFETVIITSLNEGKFPAGKSMNSFIPYDVKRELGLPTYKEKDAIYTYHFYHLLQRAKNIYLLYNTENEGLDGGEKSRFITQLEVEKQPNHILTHDIYSPKTPEANHNKMVIPKSKLVMERLNEIAQKGFSPSALTSYIRNPIDFYFQKVLQINEADEVEENIALNTLGTIIHKTLETLYTPLLNKILAENDIENCVKQIDNEVLTQFKNIYKEGEIKKGKNLLAFEVAKRNVYNFMKMELENIKNGDKIEIIALEKTLEKTLNHKNLPFPVLIKGNVDRIEICNNKIRIIDYKTGRVEARNTVLSTWNNLTNSIDNDKIIQLLTYAYLFDNQENKLPIVAGIISFKNLKSGFLPFSFKVDKTTNTIIDEEILNNYTEQMVLLLNEIFDETINFEEKV